MSLNRWSSSIKSGAFRHLSALLKVAGICYKTKVQKPLQEIYHTLQSVDLHPRSLILALKEKVYNSSTRCLLSARLLLGHVPATETTPQRPAIVLSPGDLYIYIYYVRVFILMEILIIKQLCFCRDAPHVTHITRVSILGFLQRC